MSFVYLPICILIVSLILPVACTAPKNKAIEKNNIDNGVDVFSNMKNAQKIEEINSLKNILKVKNEELLSLRKYGPRTTEIVQLEANIIDDIAETNKELFHLESR